MIIYFLYLSFDCLNMISLYLRKKWEIEVFSVSSLIRNILSH